MQTERATVKRETKKPSVHPAIAELKFHPIAEAFPLMDETELVELGADIKANGLRNPIVLYEDQVIDGRNRCTAAKQVEFAITGYETYEGDDPISFVISQNLHRRHLDTGQRAAIAAELAAMHEGRPEKKATAQKCAVSQEKAAKKMNVSRRTVQKAKQV